MTIFTRMCTSLDGFVTTADGAPVQVTFDGWDAGALGFYELQARRSDLDADTDQERQVHFESPASRAPLLERRVPGQHQTHPLLTSDQRTVTGLIQAAALTQNGPSRFRWSNDAVSGSTARARWFGPIPGLRSAND